MRTVAQHEIALDLGGRRNSGFVKLRRGLRDHLGAFPPQALKLWLLLLLNAGWKGSNKALCYFDRGDLSKYLDVSPRGVSHWLSWLRHHGYIEIIKHANQHSAGVVRILNFDTGDDTGDTRASAKKPHMQKELVQELVQEQVQKNGTCTAASHAASESYVPLRSEEVEEVSSNKKKEAPSAPARPSALPCFSTVSVEEKSKANQKLPLERKEFDLTALARSKSLAVYRPLTEQEIEQRRQKQKLGLEEWAKRNGIVVIGSTTAVAREVTKT